MGLISAWGFRLQSRQQQVKAGLTLEGAAGSPAHRTEHVDRPGGQGVPRDGSCVKNAVQLDVGCVRSARPGAPWLEEGSLGGTSHSSRRVRHTDNTHGRAPWEQQKASRVTMARPAPVQGLRGEGIVLMLNWRTPLYGRRIFGGRAAGC